MHNLASPITLPPRLLLLASNGRTEEPKPPASTPVGSQDGNLHGPRALIFSPKYSSQPRSQETPCYFQAGRAVTAPSWPMAEIGRAAALPAQHFQFLSCKHTPGMVSSKALCKLKAALAARLTLHRIKKINQEKLFLLASHIHSPGAGEEKATGQRTSLPGLPAARPSLLLLLLAISPAFSKG